MSSKRDVLAQLSREELLSVALKFELQVADRRKKDDLNSVLLTGEVRVRVNSRASRG